MPGLDDPRVLLSRDGPERYCLFIPGSLESFGRLPAVGNIEHKSYAVDVQTREKVAALKLSAPPNAVGNVAMAHIAYELAQEVASDPEVDNASLIRRVAWILELLGHHDSPMSPEAQRGLLAELLFLGELLDRAPSKGRSPDAVVDRWVRGRRDFQGGSIAVEVKATAQATRRHHIGSLEQLTPDNDAVQVFLYSVGVRHDPASTVCLPNYVDRVRDKLVGSDGEPLPAATEVFESKLESAGYSFSHEGIYRSGPGMLLNQGMPAALFALEDIPRLDVTSFKDDRMPAGIVNVAYELEITADPLDAGRHRAVIDGILSP